MGLKARQSSWTIWVLLVLAAILWLKDHQRDLSAVVQGEESAARGDGRYERIEGCRWVDHRQNDGDSFRVRLPDGRVEQLRLYFVDAPESAFKNYGGGRSNRERIEDQARDMRVSPDRAVETGVEAKNFTHELMGGESFAVLTEWDDPFGDQRYHAFVEMPGGGWLHEELVRRGLVRIHTKGEDVPGGLRRDAQERHLKDLERVAREAGRGVWGSG